MTELIRRGKDTISFAWLQCRKAPLLENKQQKWPAQGGELPSSKDDPIRKIIYPFRTEVFVTSLVTFHRSSMQPRVTSSFLVVGVSFPT
jgi:hypothetical protein